MDISKIRAFENNEVIQEMMSNESWTVSDISQHKKPLDMKRLLVDGFIGAPVPSTEYNPLVRYDQLSRYLGFTTDNLSNVAYRFDGLNDRYCVLDIEKTCPEDLKQEMLKLPYLYGEYSWSGKGYHLIFPFPKDITTEEKLITALKQSRGSYEILINHYCTFTRNTLPKIRNDINNTNPDGFNKLFKNMSAAYLAKQRQKQEVNVENLEDLNSIPDLDTLERKIDNLVYKKTQQDFLHEDNITPDISKYEYGYMSFVYHALKRYINDVWGNPHYYNHKFTDSEIANLMYRAAVRNLTPREKWNEKRRGLPYLLYAAESLIAKNKEPDTDD